MADPLLIDGAYGEGGGQILRSALSLSLLTGRALRIVNLRAQRRRPGLAAQHLTAVRAAAALCAAEVEGDALQSQTLTFIPRRSVRPGIYRFDVGAAREGGSAGAAALVLQTILLPLAMADEASDVSVIGGTHMPLSPSFDYIAHVWLPFLRRLGLVAEVELKAWGWYPVGQGEIVARIGPRRPFCDKLRAVAVEERGALKRITGRAVAANLPAHIPQRMSDRARKMLEFLGCRLDIVPQRVTAACPGAGIFLAAEYENVSTGFDALGARGKPSEQVADEAVAALVAHHDTGAALDSHLADQVLLPLALADGPSHFTAEVLSDHLRTNAWVIERFKMAEIDMEEEDQGRWKVTVRPYSAPDM